MNTKLLILLCATLPFPAFAQINYDGGVYTQDFDTLSNGTIYTPYTNMPAGWTFGSASHSGSYTWTTVTNGYSNNYGEYCFSLAPGHPDKAPGLVIGTTGPGFLGARFRNATGVALKAFSLSYFAEQWRKGAVTANDQVIPFSYSLTSTSLTSGVFVDVPALDMHSINDGDGIAAALNGNDASNRRLITGTVSGIMWAPNQDLWIRWSGAPYSFFAAHAMAIDDLSFRAVPELRILPNGPAQYRVSWSTNYSSCDLQSAPAPTATNWDATTNVPAIVGSEYSVGFETTDTPRFFRLKMK
jgi:hypothetical protein